MHENFGGYQPLNTELDKTSGLLHSSMDGLLVGNNTDRQTSGSLRSKISWLLLYYRAKPAEQSIHDDNRRNSKLFFFHVINNVGSSFGGGLRNMR